MATFEQFGVLLQVNDQVYRLVRNVRANAADYKAAIARGIPAAQVGTVMQEDAAAFLVRLQTLTDIVTRNQALVSSALAIIGVTLAQGAALRDTMVAVAQHVQAATLTTDTDVTTEADYVLANTPAWDGLF